ncbi:MAG: hypothetical protein WC805_02430 [Patescibacteria group bacterium]|jgi:hypothetical protein
MAENSLVESLKLLLKDRLAKKQDSIALFMLLNKEDSTENWDLLVSPYLSKKQPDAYKDYLTTYVTALSTTLSTEDLSTISRVVTLDPSSPLVKNITSTLRVTDPDNMVSMENVIINQIPIKKARIFLST